MLGWMLAVLDLEEWESEDEVEGRSRWRKSWRGSFRGGAASTTVSNEVPLLFVDLIAAPPPPWAGPPLTGTTRAGPA